MASRHLAYLITTVPIPRRRAHCAERVATRMRKAWLNGDTAQDGSLPRPSPRSFGRLSLVTPHWPHKSTDPLPLTAHEWREDLGFHWIGLPERSRALAAARPDTDSATSWAHIAKRRKTIFGDDGHTSSNGETYTTTVAGRRRTLSRGQAVYLP